LVINIITTAVFAFKQLDVLALVLAAGLVGINFSAPDIEAAKHG
jgi:hypothetical protein